MRLVNLENKTLRAKISALQENLKSSLLENELLKEKLKEVTAHIDKVGHDSQGLNGINDVESAKLSPEKNPGPKNGKGQSNVKLVIVESVEEEPLMSLVLVTNLDKTLCVNKLESEVG